MNCGMFLIRICFPLQAEEIEKEVLELLLGSLKLCDKLCQDCPQQKMYIVRLGSICHCLGNIYSRSYNTNQKKNILSLCRLYYEKGMKKFQDTDSLEEYLAIQVDRLELQNNLFNGKHTSVYYT